MTFAEYAPVLRDLLADTHLALHEVARFPHSLVGAKLFGTYSVGTFDEHEDAVFGRRVLVDGVLDVSLDEVVLFARTISKRKPS